MEGFVIAVIKLRQCQKAWERVKSKETLNEKIFWEMEIDSQVKRVIKYISKNDLKKFDLSTILP